jgi:hypothetical protein
LSLELVVTVTLLKTLVPGAGEVIEMLGGVVSVLLLTLTVSLAELELPVVSRAVALTVWLPFA